MFNNVQFAGKYNIFNVNFYEIHLHLQDPKPKI